ncbi:MAG: putative ABC transporter permease, partial [Oscillospiraceae bacterium]|nr:putative ABC transporter permease [Oscillospiraceae bacterium]
MQHFYVDFLGNTVFELYFYFLWWSVFGWFLEVVDRTLETGGFENRGFLNGPICPIYGFGVIIITHVLAPLKGNILILYVLSVAICTSFELFVGVLMEKLFHAKWWDYS